MTLNLSVNLSYSQIFDIFTRVDMELIKTSILIIYLWLHLLRDNSLYRITSLNYFHRIQSQQCAMPEKRIR